MSKTIFITGANGFLGSRIAIIAKKRKYNVIALVRESSNLENLKKLDIELCVGDLRDKESLRPGIKKAEIIFHVAADYRLWAKKKSDIYDANVYGTENLLKVSSEIGNKKIIYTSSVATLGLNHGSVSNEETPVHFKNMIGDYKKSKFIAEQIFQEYVKSKKISGIILNPSTPIGPGDFKPTPTGKIILQMLNRKMPAYVDTGLNFVHVDDVALGHFLALEKGKVGQRYILGGENLMFKDFLDLISDYASIPKIVYKLSPKYLYPFAYMNEFFASIINNYDPMLTVDGLSMSKQKMFFSSEKAKKQLGYRPRDIKSAIKDAVDWIKMKF